MATSRGESGQKSTGSNAQLSSFVLSSFSFFSLFFQVSRAVTGGDCVGWGGRKSQKMRWSREF